MVKAAAAKLQIRRAVAADVEAIVEIEERSFAHASERFHRRQIRGLVANPRAEVVVGVVGKEIVAKQIVGWAAGLIRQSQKTVSGRVYALAIDANARGLGAGRKLLGRLIGELEKRGSRRIYLEVAADNLAAIGLYQSMGFVEHRKLQHYYARHRHAIRMRLDDQTTPRNCI